MTQQKIELVQNSSKPVAEIFAALSDHNRLGRVFGIPVRRIKDGSPDVNGVGSVRRIGPAPLALEETVLDFNADESIDYEITRGGGPIKNHHGRLDFSSVKGGGSRVNWVITFESPIPLVGGLVKFILDRGLRSGLKKIA